MSYCVKECQQNGLCTYVCIWDVTHICMCMYYTMCGGDPVLWVKACDVLLCRECSIRGYCLYLFEQ